MKKMNETVNGIKIGIRFHERYMDYVVLLPQADQKYSTLKVNDLQTAMQIYEYAKELAMKGSEVNYIGMLIQEYKEKIK